MAKSADAFRTISEVAEWLDTPAHVLRFWESKFSQVKPVKRAGGRRYYRPQDMRLLGGIKKLLHDDGMTIKGVQKLLREEGVKSVAALSQPLAGEDAIDHTPQAAPPSEEPASEPAEVLDFKRQRQERPATTTAETDAPGASARADDAARAAEDRSAEDEPPAAEVAPPDPGRKADLPAEPEPTFPAETPADPEPDAIPSATDPAGPAGDDPAPDQAATVPPFLSRNTDGGGEVASPAPEQKSDPGATEGPDTGAETGAPAPLKVDVPADPGDSDFAEPGLLSQLAALPRPLPGPVVAAAGPCLEKLRERLKASASD